MDNGRFRNLRISRAGSIANVQVRSSSPTRYWLLAIGYWLFAPPFHASSYGSRQ
jgi:hypothetical protein